MKNTLLSTLGILSFGLFSLVSAQASFFDESVDNIVAAASSQSVEGLSATPGNGSVILIWDTKHNADGEEAEKYRIEYGTESVAGGLADSYEFQQTTLDNVPSIKIEDLTNGTPYYFAAVAIFADGTETPLSEEVSATPVGTLDQNISETPVVISAEAVDMQTVRVLFSEDVQLPESNPDLAFSITEDANEQSILEVSDAVYDTNPETGEQVLKDVLVSTKTPQQEGVSYRITVSAQVTDLDGNAIESGSTDSAVFTGTSTPPSVDTPEASSAEEDMYSAEAEGAQDLVGELDGAGDATGDAFSEMMPNAIGDGVTLEDILNGIDETVSEDTSGDTTPPEDITNLTYSLKARLTDFLVTLSWTASKNSAGDLNDQLLYRSEGEADTKIDWETPVSLGKEATKTEIPEKPETNVVYKITTKDIAGNESVGVIRSIRIPMLPSTGGGLLIAAGIALAGAGVRRMKK